MTKCKLCKKESSKNMSCKICKKNGCDNCVKVACCDCDILLCRKCRNGDALCKCYGSCSSCGTDVNRGANGWPCYECKQWYCDTCIYKSECNECKISHDTDSEC